MGRRATISDEVILTAARHVFLMKGVAGTMAEVARIAGIGEGTVFTRFPTKQALFRAAMQPQMEEPLWLSALTDGTHRDTRQALTDAAYEAAGFFQRIIPMVMMMWSNERERGRLPEPLRSRDPVPLRALERLTRWFGTEMAAGRLRKQDPEVLARIFLGSMQSYAMFALLAGAHGRPSFPADRYVRGFIEQFWEGAAPPGWRRRRLMSERSLKIGRRR
jgi:AcrR family transcriptional regulator